MDIKTVTESKFMRGAIFGIAAFIVLLLIFYAGVAVGYHKAIFSYRWGEAYHRNFGGPRGGFIAPLMNEGGLPNPHGVFGRIIKIDLPTVAVTSPDGAEKIVTIKDDTSLQRFNEAISANDLRVDDQIVVVGEPNSEGQVEAKFIRVMSEHP